MSANSRAIKSDKRLPRTGMDCCPAERLSRHSSHSFWQHANSLTSKAFSFYDVIAALSTRNGPAVCRASHWLPSCPFLPGSSFGLASEQCRHATRHGYDTVAYHP